MSKHEKYTRLKRQIGLCLAMGVALFSAAPMAYAATSVVANNQLPGNILSQIGNVNADRNGNTMTITQGEHNAVIKWDKFDVGGNATVNFKGPDAHYNTLNYVSGGSLSQIYGTINATYGKDNAVGGNIYIVNPAGVQIGNSAQINVGSLYVSTNELNDADFTNFINNAGTDTFALGGTRTAAALMSLGNINANKVTFEGDGRIVIDTERIKDVAGDNKLSYDKINIITDEKNLNNLVIGYDGYDESANNGEGSYEGANTDEGIAQVNGNKWTKAKGYMWVEDVKQLQAIDTNLGGNYALRNSIDATGTVSWNDSDADNKNEGFKSIGVSADGKVTETTVNGEKKYGFYGNFDGLDYNIFGLTINRDISNVGLFGVAHDANINNVTLVGGSITGGNVVGSVVGAALGNTHITNATNSASVTGNTDVGGIVGYSGDEIDNVGDNGTTEIVDADAHFTNLINTGSVQSNGENDGNNGIISNAGGLIGYMYNGTLDGNSYNLGNVSGNGYNVGGLVGHAVHSVIGNAAEEGKDVSVVYNRLGVTGVYNVGGIVGNMEGTTVQNVENRGTVTATGHTTENYIYHTAITDGNNIPNGGILDGENDIARVTVDIANAGGIVGTSAAKDEKASEIKNATNTGNVSSSKVKDQEYYAAGNVGGVVGRAEDTNITNATNKENEVRGAHNVGGIAGYFGNSNDNSDIKYTINTGTNNGGDIMATGARGNDEFVKELVRRMNDGSDERFTVGNIGGIVGYMDGDHVYVTGSANRGTVHTSEPADPAAVKDWEKAANVGGVVGKIDRSDTLELKNIMEDVTKAAVSNSYNTGDVLGYTGVGGVVGMMYNGEVAGSYNLGYIGTTRQTSDLAYNIESLNMGGVVGDTTENANVKGVVIYDVYNKGQIGDSEFKYWGRHVGGIVGRLSGTVEKAYNNGAIYNGYSVVGGIAGWMAEGSINNAFNTGNITVYNQNNGIESQVGGIAGAVKGKEGTTRISNAYNLGTIRSFRAKTNTGAKGINVVGGIVGDIRNSGEVIIQNVYTTGNIYAGIENAAGKIDEDTSNNIGSIYGRKNSNTTRTNAYYIKPAKDENDKPLFTELTGNKDNSNKAIEFKNKDRISKYQYDDEEDGKHYSLTFTQQADGDVDGNGSIRLNGVDKNGDPIVETIDQTGEWRIYDGNTPILNAFLPNAEHYFSGGTGKENAMDGIDSIQYGTAYDPLLTIINAASGTNELNYNWQDLDINSAAGIAVYGAGLTLNDFKATGGSGFFGGTIYADGALNINGNANNINIGSAADIYGSAVNITTDGKVTIYGDVTATGNGTTTENNPDIDGSGSITINAGDVDVYGKLTSASDTQGLTVTIPGINGTAVEWTPGTINDPYESMADIADRFAHTTGTSAVDGNITINAGVDAEGNAVGDGNVNLYYGNKGEGLITSGGNLNVSGTGDVYVDSDLDIGGDMTLSGAGADSEVVLDITNIGQVQAKNGKVSNNIAGLNNFLNHFSKNAISFGNTEDAKITVNMWVDNELNLGKFGDDFTDKLNNLEITEANDKTAQDLTHIWVSNGEQLKGIQEATEANNAILGYNFALKGDINASHVEDYKAIGGENGEFTGTFDGRGNRIIGLDTTKDSSGGNTNSMTNAGIFSTVGEGGVVKDVNIYSGTFTGTTNAGSVAGVNNGRIEGVVTFGNTIQSTGENSNAGGIAGTNSGEGTFDTDGKLTGNGIYDVESTSSVIASSGTANAGGLVGTNDGALGNSFSDSAVTVATGNTLGEGVGLGGVVGVNNGNVQYVDSLGVTNGGDTGSNDIGGIIGINNGNMYSGYNESIVSGENTVGGIIGNNAGTYENGKWDGGTVENVVNATRVTGEDNVGGLIGINNGSVTNGRNNGTITGTKFVGGLVGDNAHESSILTNLVNDSSAEILGVTYVGGIAGNNNGTITAKEQNLVNRGSITGNEYVGGVAGLNTGIIMNTNNDVELHASGTNAQYFGGVVGQNGTEGTQENDGIIENATNTNTILAPDAEYVGGIAGWNTSQGQLIGMGNSNEGTVIGGSYVGGVIGKNNADIGGIDQEQVGITNEGKVIATQGGAGGLIGENNAAITNTIMTNRGEVHGNNADDDSGTGGIIGVNNGNITYSSLMNEINGIVTGTHNVGGLIGVNRGDITGGRETVDDTDAGMYINKIYNNGEIQVGRYTYDNQDGTYEFQQFIGSNIGGLFGENSGEVTAAYNTGAIVADGSTNVGGIAGTNEKDGKLDQVFSTVFNKKDDTNGSISGGTNTGGLVGTNAGTLSNAYNTSTVNGTNVGTIVGNNTGNVENVYSTIAGDLTGDNSKVNHGYIVTDDDEWKDHDAYIGFDFDSTDEDGTGNIWKNYDGYGNPLLKVFLTTVTYDPGKGDLGFIHNGSDIKPDIGQMIRDDILQAPDRFDAHWNVKGGLIFHGSDSSVDVGTYWDYLWSKQIAFSNDSPNWLGYDLQPVSYEIIPRPEGPQDGENWSFLYNDAPFGPFDRNRDFRERKAEINFVDGGMEI